MTLSVMVNFYYAVLIVVCAEFLMNVIILNVIILSIQTHSVSD
jgi:hypothetical protein